MSEIPCAPEVFRVLGEWPTPSAWQEIPNASSKEIEIRQSPTKELGTWIRMEAGEDKVRLIKSTISEVKKFEWKAPACLPELSSIARSSERTKSGAFRDSDLFRLVGKAGQNQVGIVYLWTPHMPISVDGLLEAKKFAEKKGFHFTALAAPNSDVSEMSATIKKFSLDRKFARTHASSELLKRGAGLHYPAMILYRKNEIATFAYLGYYEPQKFSQIVEEWKKE